MKEFDKWIKELAQQHPMLYTRRFFAQMAWEAALKWVLSEIHEHREAMDVIEEELEDK